jgi:hypothetical protein
MAANASRAGDVRPDHDIVLPMIDDGDHPPFERSGLGAASWRPPFLVPRRALHPAPELPRRLSLLSNLMSPLPGRAIRLEFNLLDLAR